jgi:hypothetical protein
MARPLELEDDWEGEVAERAAESAVRQVQQRIVEIGGSPEEGRALAEAMKVMLLREPGHKKRARQVLEAAGFKPGTIEEMLTRMERSF